MRLDHLPAAATRFSPAGLAFFLAASAWCLLGPGTAAWAQTAPGQYGTIKGRLVWGGTFVPEPALLIKQGDTNVKDAAVCSAKDLHSQELVVDRKTMGVRYAFAYLNRPNGTNPAAAQAILDNQPDVVIDQKNCEFVPRCTALMKGQGILFKSSDPIGHNVRYSGFTNTANNVALPPQGQLKVRLVAERRPMPLLCDLHPWMKGYMFVFDHPFFTVTGEDGSFEITGVPAGSQKLVLWQEKVGHPNPGAAVGMDVMVTAGEATDVGVIEIAPGKAPIPTDPATK